MKLIWATRGLHWGFRFLDDGGFADPLPEYDAVFSAVGRESEACERVGDRVALRFPDPEGRVDSAGRVIPHEFVVFPPHADDIRTLDDALRLVWGKVAADYAARYEG